MVERKPGWGYRSIEGYKYHYSDDMKTPICNPHLDVSYEYEPWNNPSEKPKFCCRTCQNQLEKILYNHNVKIPDAFEITHEGTRYYECPICRNVLYPATFPGFGYCHECRKDYKLPLIVIRQEEKND